MLREITTILFALLLIVCAHLFGWWALILAVAGGFIVYVGSGAVEGAYLGVRDAMRFHRSKR
jgi:hypothetical protein